MLTKDFIQETLIEGIGRMTIGSDYLASNAYIGFSLVCQAIEVLGACFDEYDWEDRYLSELRFRLAIKKLFPEKCITFNDKKAQFDLYKNLRCPMVHQMRPGKYIGLSQRKHEKAANVSNLHLSMQDKHLVLIYEDFFGDFRQACQMLIKMIDDKKFQAEKVYGHNISVPSDV